MGNNFIERYIKTPPAIFPLVALFHVGLLVFSMYTASAEPVSSGIWIDVWWMLAYTACWLFVCALKKWAAFCYITLTMANLVLYLLYRNDAVMQAYISSLFMADIMFSFFILAYFKRFS